ncbi:MAG TPA: MAPEG family protein [Xanthobacteraceae bacterium]|nr:MAPEG family protein [Xanthobacteraceae bacterium]
MTVAITALYTGVFALFLVAGGINVAVHRGKYKITLSDGGHPDMLRMVRIHGNAAEYLPIGALLMGLYEIDGGKPLALHIAGIALIVGRVLFTAGLWTTPEPRFGRVAGMTVTWLALAALALLNFWQIG